MLNEFIKLQGLFRNKAQYEHEISACSATLLNKEDRIAKQDLQDIKEAILRIEQKKSFGEDQLIKAKLRFACMVFNNKVSILIESIEHDINEKINVVSEKKLKIEFLNDKLKQTSEIAGNIISIIKQYTLSTQDLKAMEELLTNYEKLSSSFAFPQIEILDERILEIFADNAYHALINLDENKNIFKTIFSESKENIYADALFKALEGIKKLNKRLVINNREIFDSDNLVKIKNGIIGKIESGDYLLQAKVNNERGSTYTDLEQVFTGDERERREKYKKAISALQSHKPIIVNENLVYVLGMRRKNAVVWWWQLLKEKFYIIDDLSSADAARLLNKVFSNLNISERAFRREVRTKYKNSIRLLIS